MNTQQGLGEIKRIAADKTVVANVESKAEVKMAETVPVKTPSTVIPSVDDSSLYIHRELSQLQFNVHMLEQALDESYPLLERLKLLLISSSNLDEFFEICIAGLKKQIIFAHEQAGTDGLPLHQALARTSELIHKQVSRQYRILNETLLPELAKHQVRFIRRYRWMLKIETWVRRFFRDEIASIVTPIDPDPTHPFPLLVNKSLNFIIELEEMDASGHDSGLAIIPAPRLLPRIIKLPGDVGDEDDNYVLLSSMIHVHADDLFPNMKAEGYYQFRLTHNADLPVDTENVKDLAHTLCGELFSHCYGDAARPEAVDTCLQNLVNYLLKQLGLSEGELYKVSGPVNLTRLFSVISLESHPELQYPPFTPTIPYLLQRKGNLFNVLSKFDVLLMHSFEPFTPAIDLLRRAAKGPNVLAIKQTLYRSGTSSEIVDALVETVRDGKEVTTVIKLRVRFNEESNLQPASCLQQVGVVVICGATGFKTHARMILILRRENGELRHYAYLGTGNYHADNTHLYTDYSLLTVDVALCEGLHKLFNQLIGMGKTLRMKKPLHAPFTLKKSLLEMVNHEAAQATLGQPAYIIAKVNSLTDPKIIRTLYKASQTGIRIDLVVRGMCCLRSSIPGISHSIHMRSVIGHFLGYNRIYYFFNSGDEKLYLSSTDWMGRNLDTRVETCFPVEGKKLVQRVKKEPETYLTDNTQAWVLQADGGYQRLSPTGNQNPHNTQATLLEKLATPVLITR